MNSTDIKEKNCTFTSDPFDNSTDDVDDVLSKSSNGLRMFAALLTMIIISLGIAGNSLTVAALIKCPKIRNVTATFIISLCAADFCFSILVMPFSAHRFLYGRDPFNHDSFMCVLQPFIQYGNVGISLLLIAMITINRYITLAHQNLCKRIYTTRSVALMVAFTWIFSFGILIPTLCGSWGRFGFDTCLGSCSIITDKKGGSPKKALFIFAFLIPCIAIIICYTRIFWVVRRSEQRIRRHNSRVEGHAEEVNNGGIGPGFFGAEWRLTKMVLAIFLSFIICYLPITVVKLVDENVQHPEAHLISYVLIYLSACINPIIYVIMSRQYRQAYKSVLCSKWMDERNIANTSANDKCHNLTVGRTCISNVSMGDHAMTSLPH